MHPGADPIETEKEGLPVATCWDHLWASEAVGRELDELSIKMFEILSRVRDRWEQVRVLEAGSGTGRISLRLQGLGARVSFLDISSPALTMARRWADASDAAFVKGNLLGLPFADETFEVTWNGGVLEHLSVSELEVAISEMARVTKKGGHVVSFNPNRRCVPYRIGKTLLESRGEWQYGYEEPVSSLADSFSMHGLDLLEEYDIGVARGFAFLPQMPRQFLRVLDRAEPVLRHLGVLGYLVVSIGRKS